MNLLIKFVFVFWTDFLIPLVQSGSKTIMFVVFNSALFACVVLPLKSFVFGKAK